MQWLCFESLLYLTFTLNSGNNDNELTKHLWSTKWFAFRIHYESSRFNQRCRLVCHILKMRIYIRALNYSIVLKTFTTSVNEYRIRFCCRVDDRSLRIPVLCKNISVVKKATQEAGFPTTCHSLSSLLNTRPLDVLTLQVRNGCFLTKNIFCILRKTTETCTIWFLKHQLKMGKQGHIISL